MLLRAIVLGAALCHITSTHLYAVTNLTETQKLTASDAEANDLFGISVGIDNNYALIGAEWDDDVDTDAGAAYLFDLTNGNQIHKFTAFDGYDTDQYGWAVSIGGNKAVVGSVFDDDDAFKSGSAYLYDLTDNSLISKITGSNLTSSSFFGHSLAVDQNYAIIGAPGQDSIYDGSGAVYLFNANTGSEIMMLKADDAGLGDHFGHSVAFSGNTAIIGAPYDNDNGDDSGSAYLFDILTGDQLFKLTASDASIRREFGSSVAIYGNMVIVGARDDYSDIGSAYIYDATTGAEIHKLSSPDPASGDWFGTSVAISDRYAVVGAPYDDYNTDRSGKVYVFDVITGDLLFKLSASDGASVDQFGNSVSISGLDIIVGAHTDDDHGNQSGSAYVFRNIPEPSSLLLLIPTLASITTRRRKAKFCAA